MRRQPIMLNGVMHTPAGWVPPRAAVTRPRRGGANLELQRKAPASPVKYGAPAIVLKM